MLPTNRSKQSSDATRSLLAGETQGKGAKIVRVDAVGASVSSELFRNGLLELGISLLMILAYIWFRFEWQFAVGAVVTLILDVTKAIGFLALTRIEFDLVMVAAILTILGYSTNDKVVVYDRVRENLRKYKVMPLRDLIDLCHRHQVLVSTGGFLEYVLPQGTAAVERTLGECRDLGFDIVEVSSGFVTLPVDDLVRLTRRVQQAGLKAKPEVGIQFGAGGATGSEPGAMS